MSPGDWLTSDDGDLALVIDPTWTDAAVIEAADSEPEFGEEFERQEWRAYSARQRRDVGADDYVGAWWGHDGELRTSITVAVPL